MHVAGIAFFFFKTDYLVLVEMANRHMGVESMNQDSRVRLAALLLASP